MKKAPLLFSNKRPQVDPVGRGRVLVGGSSSEGEDSGDDLPIVANRNGWHFLFINCDF